MEEHEVSIPDVTIDELPEDELLLGDDIDF